MRSSASRPEEQPYNVTPTGTRPRSNFSPSPQSRSQRDSSCSRCCTCETGTFYLTCAILFISINYCAYAVVIFSDFLTSSFPTLQWLYLIFFHCIFALLIASFVQTVNTNPGSVPPNWGFYRGDADKRHRYCRVCNIWKPYRTHHCSACGRCILNMDHHCPWVNNCVGFYNRKFFIQLLIYGLLSLFMEIAHTSYFVVQHGSKAIQVSFDQGFESLQRLTKMLGFIVLLIILMLSVTLCIGLIPFTRFHIKLVLKNSTTIENLDASMRARRQYDLGKMRNLQQVMGPEICLWWMPCHTRASRPVGNGVRWTQHYVQAYDNDG